MPRRSSAAAASGDEAPLRRSSTGGSASSFCGDDDDDDDELDFLDDDEGYLLAASGDQLQAKENQSAGSNVKGRGAASGNKLKPTKSVVRRNERERNRVKRLNQGFERLRQYVNVPGLSKKKLSKLDILRAATCYIEHLQTLRAATDVVVAAAAVSDYQQPSVAEQQPCSSQHLLLPDQQYQQQQQQQLVQQLQAATVADAVNPNDSIQTSSAGFACFSTADDVMDLDAVNRLQPTSGDFATLTVVDDFVAPFDSAPAVVAGQLPPHSLPAPPPTFFSDTSTFQSLLLGTDDGSSAVFGVASAPQQQPLLWSTEPLNAAVASGAESAVFAVASAAAAQQQPAPCWSSQAVDLASDSSSVVDSSDALEQQRRLVELTRWLMQ